jgi:outer membrane protein
MSAFYRNDYQDYSGNDRSFSEQFKHNGKEGIRLTLRIPIFNSLQARTNLNNSLINYESSKYDLQLEKNNLLKQIQQVRLNAVAAMKKYYSSEKAVKSAEEAFRYVEEKFNLGIVTPLEYNDSKNKVTNSQSSFIQAKYEYIFRIKILDFYNGKDITL